MSHSPADLFPTWYRSISPTVTPELVSSRINAIYVLISNENLNFWLDVIRMAYERPVKDQSSKDFLVDKFHDADINFDLVSNENLIRVLSGITLCFKIADVDAKDNFPLCLAVANFNSLDQYKESEVPFRQRALNYLDNITNDLNEEGVNKDLKILDETLENLTDSEDLTLDNQDCVSLIKTIQILNSERIRFSEELNCLWWLMGEYSNFYNKFFSDIGSVAMVIPGAFELHELTTFSQEIKSGKPFLQKVLTLADKGKIPKETSIFDVINSISADNKSRMLVDTRRISEFTPCLLALKTAMDIGGTQWVDAYAAFSSNADIKSKRSPKEISFKFYREFIFISTN